MPLSNWSVIGPRLLLRPIDSNRSTTLFRPGTANEEFYTRECEVVMIGQDREGLAIQPSQFHIGQHVYIMKDKAAGVEIDGEELVMVEAETDVLLVEVPTRKSLAEGNQL